MEFYEVDSSPTYTFHLCVVCLYCKMYKISPFNGHIVRSTASHLIEEHEELLKCVKKWPVREQANALVDIHCLLVVS